MYISLGTLPAVATEMNIPYETLRHWKKQPWWKQHERAIKNEENAALSARYRKIATKVQDQILDRLDGGDHYVLKDGSTIRVPVKARELAVIGAVATDKVIALDRTLELKEDQGTVEHRLKLLAEQLINLAKGKLPKETNVIEAEYAEQERETGEIDESGSPQPEVCEESGSPDSSSAGVHGSGPT